MQAVEFAACLTMFIVCQCGVTKDERLKIWPRRHYDLGHPAIPSGRFRLIVVILTGHRCPLDWSGPQCQFIVSQREGQLSQRRLSSIRHKTESDIEAVTCLHLLRRKVGVEVL